MSLGALALDSQRRSPHAASDGIYEKLGFIKVPLPRSKCPNSRVKDRFGPKVSKEGSLFWWLYSQGKDSNNSRPLIVWHAVRLVTSPI